MTIHTMPTVRKVERPWVKKADPKARWAHQTHNGISNDDYRKAPWRKARQRQLDKQPLCERCLANHKLVTATVVDHIDPVRLGGSFLDVNNHMSLCTSCHNRKSAGERGQ